MKLARCALIALLAASCSTVPKPLSVAPAPGAPQPAARPATGFVLSGTATQGGLMFGTVPTDTLRLTLDGRDVPVARDGRFVIGFGRDAAPSAVLAAALPGGQTATRTLAVAARAWQTETLNTLPRRSLPSEEYERIRSSEVAKIEAARAAVTPAEGWRQRFVWPVTGRISGVFGSQRIYKGGEKGDPHSGVDIAGTTGTPIVAPADGVVILAAERPFTLEGNLLMIDHGMGVNSAFLHLSRIDVRLGDRVARGQPLGAIGATGRTTGPHLHWGMKWREQRIDPQLLVADAP